VCGKAKGDRVKKIAVLIVLMLCVATAAGASEPFKFFISPGFGVGSAGSKTGLAVGLDGSVLSKKMIWSARVTVCEEFVVLGKARRSWDVALLAGLHRTESHQFMSIQAGISYFGNLEAPYAIPDTDYRGNQTKYAIGLALQGQYFYRCIGLTAYGNVNDLQTMLGVLLSCRFGSW
jgi:hypothetical protein